jgi:DNA-binding LacI/PurR family transcriptional regulator
VKKQPDKMLPSDGKRVGLKSLGEYLDLSPATISLVLNRSPLAMAIPEVTRDRVVAAAKKFNYRPNLLARSLRMNRTHTIGIIAPEHSEGYFTNVMMGIESYLIQAGYLYFTVSHLGKQDLLDEYPRLLMSRNIDGLLLINTRLNEAVDVPAVAISSHSTQSGVTDILLDHDRASVATLKHLYDLGHRRIAFMRGQVNSLDAGPRWDSLMKAARQLGLVREPELTLKLEHNSWSPDLGYPVVMDLLRRTRDFTALICFNDIAAIGAVRALADQELRCPADISVVGFDDISSAGYCIPRLTTVRQPLQQMGEAAASTLVELIEKVKGASTRPIFFAPELIVRESTTTARRLRRVAKR